MLTDEELITQAIGDYLNQATRQPIFLDQLDAQPFHKVLPAIMEFIFSTEQEGELTLMLAHNGAYWAEPLFRAELERACSAETVNRMLFVDSKQFFKHLFRNIKIEKIGGSDDDIIWSRLLGEKRAVSFDSLTDAISLWNTIIDVCDRMYGRSDIEFIFSKITEDVYLQKCQLKGI